MTAALDVRPGRKSPILQGRPLWEREPSASYSLAGPSVHAALAISLRSARDQAPEFGVLFHMRAKIKKGGGARGNLRLPGLSAL